MLLDEFGYYAGIDVKGGVGVVTGWVHAVRTVYMKGISVV